MIRVLASIIFLLTLTCAPALAASHFDGADSVIVITQQAAINVSAFTVGCWTRYATLGEGNLARIVSKGWRLEYPHPDGHSREVTLHRPWMDDAG